MSFTEVKTWSVEELMDALDSNPEKKEKIIVPQYQRNLVWKKEQKKLLIESIKCGMPIGALLLYHENAEDGYNIYHLVDGLQRSTSIKAYNEKPTLFFSKENVDENLIEELKTFFDNDVDSLVRLFVDWIQSLTGFTESEGFSSSALAYFLDEQTGEKLKKKEIRKLTNTLPKYLEKINEESNISEKKIPILVYHGNKSDLPAIFERINSRGTQLNKYQIYAATWSTYDSIDIGNIEIIKKIQDKYEALIEEGLEIENYDPSNFNTSKFNYFEYFFGLGKLLSDKYQILFGKSNSKDQTESIGFNLGSICLNHDLRKMGQLPEKLVKINIDEYEKCLMDSVQIVYEILKPYIKFKANKNGRSVPTCHTEMQIVSIIGKIFTTKYDDNFNKKEHADEKLTILKKTIPFHYLYDIIRNYWSGTGDSKAFELINSNRYETEIRVNQWEIAFNEWFDSEIDKKEKSRVNINKSSILFLKYIYTHLFSAHEELSTTIYEVEHICPIAKLKKVSKLGNVDGLPMSCISNLCLIEKKLNISKGSKTIYQYYDNLLENEEYTELQIKEEIKKLEERTFTQRSDLDFMINFKEDNLNNYFAFLHQRFDKLKETFYELNDIRKGVTHV